MSRSIVTITFQFIGRAFEKLSTLSNTLPPGSRQQLAQSFADVLVSVTDELEQFLIGAPSEEDIEQRCRHLCAIVDRFTNLMFPIFDRPEPTGIVSNLVLPILRFSPSESHYIGLLPADELNFETDMISLRHIWQVLSFRENKIDQADSSLRFFINYPHLFSNDALSLVVIGHEIAHVWYELLGGSDVVAPMIQMDSKALEEICKARALPQGSDEQFEFYSRLQTIAAAWAEEITCDIVAIHLLGPAALFAYERTVQLSGGHNFPTTTHPGSTWRCRLMIDQLELAGFSLKELTKKDSVGPNLIPGSIKELQRMVAAYGDDTPELDSAEQVAHDAIAAGLSNIRQAVADRVGVPAITMEAAIPILGPIIDSFSKGHPISDQWEKGQNLPLETRWLAFALWEIYLRQQWDEKLPPRELHSYELDLGSQFSRACNAAEVLARWRTTNRGSTD